MVYINGEFVENDKAQISVYDHGLLYGDGTFEGIRFYDKKIFLMEEHVARLLNSCKALALELNIDADKIIELTYKTIELSGLKDGYIRLLITRGRGKLGISPFLCAEPGIIIIVDTIRLYPEEFYSKGISLITSSFRRTPLDSLDTRIKSLNYLNNVLAKAEAVRAGYPEALILNHNGRIAECSGDNIFIVKKGRCITPHVVEGALEGITRGFVIKKAIEMSIDCEEGFLTLYDLFTADECFLTGTAAEIVPVVEVDKRKIGEGIPGPITAQFHNEYKKAIA